MTRRFNASQFRSKMRQAISKYNQGVRKYNDAVRKSDRERRRAISDYNQEVRRFNAAQRSRQQKIRSALAQIGQRPVVQSYSIIVSSTHSLGKAYLRLEEHAADVRSPEQQRLIIDLPRQETVNSLDVMNALTGEGPVAPPVGVALGTTAIEEELRRISADLDDRWRGAVFSLNPSNPDAARHFCTSSREIFCRMLEIAAPDGEVIAEDPSCPRTGEGKPTRRTKIHYLLRRKGFAVDALEDFVERDVQNIIELFQVFNDATHARAGRFDLPELLTIKKRVEDGILFVSGIAGQPA
jgi:hypothetical protein